MGMIYLCRLPEGNRDRATEILDLLERKTDMRSKRDEDGTRIYYLNSTDSPLAFEPMLDHIAPDWREHVGYATPNWPVFEISARYERPLEGHDGELWVATVRGQQELHVAVEVSGSAAASGTRGTEAYIVELVERKWASYPEPERYARLQADAPLKLNSTDIND